MVTPNTLWFSALRFLWWSLDLMCGAQYQSRKHDTLTQYNVRLMLVNNKHDKPPLGEYIVLTGKFPDMTDRVYNRAHQQFFTFHRGWNSIKYSWYLRSIIFIKSFDNIP